MMQETLEPRAERPNMPGYGISQAPIDASVYTWHAIGEKLAAARNYWIGSTGADGRPHAMPVWGLWLDGVFYFSTSRRSRKGRNLAKDPRVVIHLESGDDIVVLEGVVAETDDQAILSRYVEAYDRKYNIRPDVTNPADVVYRLEPAVGFSWQEKDFVESAIRWRFTGE